MPQMPHQPTPDEPTLPPALVEALRRAEMARGESAGRSPAEADQAVLAEARAHFAAREPAAAAPVARPRRLTHAAWWAAPLAAAAVIVLSVLAVQTVRWMSDFGEAARQPLALGPGSPLELAWDADRSGTLDILDVMILARQQQAGAAHITPEILDDLAMRIVALDRVAAKLPGVRAGVVLAWTGIEPRLTVTEGGRL